MKILINILIIIITSQSIYSQLVINEFMASNDTTISDNFGEFDDWIEIVNISPDTVNLYGWYLSDNDSDLLKHQISDSINIAPDSIFILWADDDLEQGWSHLNFKLAMTGEEIIITDPSLLLIDSVSFGLQQTDISFGRFPNYTGSWAIMSHATPSELNMPHDSSQYSPPGIVSHDSGLYSDFINVTIETESDSINIYYSLDGSFPHIPYSDSFLILETTVLRINTTMQGFLPSQVQTYHYILNTNYTLPTMSLVVEPDDFPIGEQEYNLHVAYFDTDGSLGFEADAGIERHGSPSQQNPYRISFKSDYGLPHIDYQIFENRDYHKFKRLILRNASNDRFPNNIIHQKSHIRDVLAHSLYKQIHPNSGYSSFQPVNVYINNSYWGIYYLRERQDKHYVEELFGYDDVDLLERAFGYTGNRNAVEGDWTAYDELETFVENEDMTYLANFEYLKNNIYYEQFIDYWILEVFVGNYDWLSNNIKYFRPRSGEDKWRWLIWDLDHGFGSKLSVDGVNWGDPNTDYLDWSTGFEGPRVWSGNNNKIIRAILRNNQGRRDFINRFSDLMNTTFSPSNILLKVDSLENLLSTDMNHHAQRWGGDMIDWYAGLDSVRNYISVRGNYINNHIKNKFDLDSTYQILIETPLSFTGAIEINSISINSFPWTGTYFSNVPITITAIPTQEDEIFQWEGSNSGSSSIVLDSLVSDTVLTLLMRPLLLHSILDQVMYEDSSLTLSLGASSVEEDPITFYAFSDTVGVDTYIYGDSLVLVPLPDWYGETNITVTATDGELSDTTTFVLYVEPRDDEPVVASRISDIYLSEDFRDTVIAQLDTVFNDIDDSLIYSYSILDTSVFSVNISSDGNLVLNAIQNAFGETELIITASNPTRASVTDTIDVLIESVNDAPEFISDLNILVDVGMPFTEEIDTYDADMDQLSLSFNNQATVPGWLVMTGNMISGTPPINGGISFMLDLSDNDTTISDTFHLRAEAFRPFITSIADVPEDQGGRVYISFSASYFDSSDETGQEYGIYRYDTYEDSSAWVMVISGPAIHQEHYVFEVTTLADSTAEDNGMSMYKVVASMNEGIFHSLPDSGYSIDNIAPGVPTGMQAIAMENSISLSWDMSEAEDFQYFSLERSNEAIVDIADTIITYELIEVSFEDHNLLRNVEYSYRLAAYDYAGNRSEFTEPVSAILLSVDPLSLIPEVFALHQNYPNPFNPTTQIRFDLPKNEFVSINIYDVMGRKIKSLVNINQEAGYRSIIWNGTNDFGQSVSVGMYIYTIQAGKFRQTRKMVILK